VLTGNSWTVENATKTEKRPEGKIVFKEKKARSAEMRCHGGGHPLNESWLHVWW